MSFDEKLDAYAKLAVRVGVNMQPNQRLTLMAPVEAANLARLVVAEAYRAGARFVDVLWSDDGVTLERFKHAPRDSFEDYPAWRGQALGDAAERGDAVLMIRGSDPDLLKGQDPELIATAQQAEREHLKRFRKAQSGNGMPWSIVVVPVAPWAARVFPSEREEQAQMALWETIFKVVRLDEPDPVAAWQAHLEDLKRKHAFLNRKRYQALVYRGPGTELTVGLPEGHIWMGGSSQSKGGTPFVANMPTEEVFTLPHRERVDGAVKSTRPLSYGGVLIEDFGFRFSGGKVVEVWAKTGREPLERLFKTDEGATRLGEVALVPNSSPISQTGLLFYNTLFDENAASHLAFGQAYRFTLEGGVGMSEEDFASAGGNSSLTHVDFMMGSGEIDIDGMTADGKLEPVMRGGEWALETVNSEAG